MWDLRLCPHGYRRATLDRHLERKDRAVTVAELIDYLLGRHATHDLALQLAFVHDRRRQRVCGMQDVK